MSRRPFAAFLLLMALGVGVLWLVSFRVLWVHYGRWVSAGFSDGEIRLLIQRGLGRNLPQDMNWGGVYVQGGVRLHVPLWVPFAVLLAYPAALLVFVGGRRLWRWRRGCCLGCGYDLRGSVSYVCPECGRPRRCPA